MAEFGLAPPLRCRTIALAGLLLSYCLDGFAGTDKSPVVEDLYLPPRGFWLSPSDRSLRLYGPTSPVADWNIAQWDIPENLPPFDASGVSKNRWATVKWYNDFTYDLSQNAASLPCDRRFPSGRNLPNEFDLFASPNGSQIPDFPRAAGTGVAIVDRLERLAFSIRLIVRLATSADNVCSKTRTIFLVALSMSNPFRHQVLFYQLRLGYFEFLDNTTKLGSPGPGWFFKGNNLQNGLSGTWGFGDDITRFGYGWAQIGASQAYDLDVLPRLRWVIMQGRTSGLDQNLAHWRIKGTYQGQLVLGHVVNDAVWSGFSLKATSP